MPRNDSNWSRGGQYNAARVLIDAGPFELTIRSAFPFIIVAALR